LVVIAFFLLVNGYFVDVDRLFNAIVENNGKDVERLVNESKVDANSLYPVTIDGVSFKWRPLNCACYYGRSRILDFLLSNGANIEGKDDHFENVRMLLFLAFGSLYSSIYEMTYVDFAVVGRKSWEGGCSETNGKDSSC
jgi:hypothetical protein